MAAADLRASIDWTPFFPRLGAGRQLSRDPRRSGGRRKRAQPVQGRAGDARPDHRRALGDPKATVGLWRCQREGDDVFVLAGNDWTRLPFLRQQVKKREGRANMCLADFINPEGEDWIGGFAVGIHGLEPHLERFKQTIDDYDDILLKALADRLAESFAEVLHAHVRNRLWGYADEHFSNAELIREKYQGIRPAPGYPACPDHSLKPILFDMLGGVPGRGHADREFRDAADLGRVRLLLRPSRQPIFRRRPHRPRPARGLCRAARIRSRRGERWLRPNLD